MAHSLLIVDDDPVICKGVMILIDWEGYGFTELDYCETAEEALKMAQKKRYTLIISDIRMKQMDGLELIRRLSALKICENLIIMSSYADFEYAQAAISYGVKGYLLKPISRYKLQECIESITGCIAAEEPPDPDENPQSVSTYKKRVLDEIIGYIHVNYKEDLKLKQIGADFHMNSAYLGKLFQEGTGMKFHDYVNRYRINRAIEYMTVKDPFIMSEVSEAVGYRDMTYFYRCFRKIMGISPVAYLDKLHTLP